MQYIIDEDVLKELLAAKFRYEAYVSRVHNIGAGIRVINEYCRDNGANSIDGLVNREFKKYTVSCLGKNSKDEAEGENEIPAEVIEKLMKQPLVYYDKSGDVFVERE